MNIIFWLCIGVAIGTIAGILATRYYLQSKTEGNLVVCFDQVDKENYIFLEMNSLSIDELRARQIVKLNVVDRTHKMHRL